MKSQHKFYIHLSSLSIWLGVWLNVRRACASVWHSWTLGNESESKTEIGSKHERVYESFNESQSKSERYYDSEIKYSEKESGSEIRSKNENKYESVNESECYPRALTSVLCSRTLIMKVKANIRKVKVKDKQWKLK